MNKLLQLYNYLRINRYANLFAINLRILLGVGFSHAGLRKIGGVPFANPGQTGVFFEYLDALHATGFYYEFVGWAQIIAGVLLITQRFALLGAFIYFPIIVNIAVLTVCTIGSLTPIIACLMSLAVLFLLLWDYSKWINLFSPDHKLLLTSENLNYPIVSKWWMITGVLTVVLPLIAAVILKLFLSKEAFMIFLGFGILVLPFIIPFVSFIIEEIRHQRNKKEIIT